MYSVNHRLPSGPAAMLLGLLASVGMGNSRIRLTARAGRANPTASTRTTDRTTRSFSLDMTNLPRPALDRSAPSRGDGEPTPWGRQREQRESRSLRRGAGLFVHR